MILHIIPLNDLAEHEEVSTCYCVPSVEILESGDMMIVHNKVSEAE